MTRYWLACSSALALAASPVSAQVVGKTQQQLDAEGTKIEVHQSHRSDSTGTSSTLGTEVHRADGSGKAMSDEQRITVAPLQPLPESSSTTTTTTINRQ